jgi:hypothetical protein
MRAHDCIIVVPPFSPNDASPPLGPAILKSHLEAASFSAHYIDLNIRYLQQFELKSRFGEGVVGDHDNDEVRVSQARDHFLYSLCLPEVDSIRVPNCDDSNSSLPHNFDELSRAVQDMFRQGFWPRFFDEHVFAGPEPVVLGISLMGPAQVPLALVLARHAKRCWPRTTVVAGGSHVTLLADRIAGDVRYGGDIDLFLPGHSEHTLVEVLQRLQMGCGPTVQGVLRAGEGWRRVPGLPPDKRLPPTFDADGLALYGGKTLTLPIQLGRGCGYGRCTYCTYPLVEDFEDVNITAITRRFVPSLLSFRPSRLSVKDSLFTVPSMRAFGKVLAKETGRLTWSATTKCSRAMDSSTMRELHAQGCTTLEMGIETIHPSSQRFFDKSARLADIEQVLDATVGAGIAVVINLIYGVAGESLADAQRQFAWWQSWKARSPNHVFGVHSILQIDVKSPLAMHPERFGLRLGEPGPWAFTFPWNAPAWTPDFQRFIDDNGGRSQ